MKIQKIIILNEAIRELVSLDKSKGIKLSKTTRIRLADNLRVLGNHVQDFYDARNDLFKELGTKVEGNEENLEVKKDSPNYDQFQAEIKNMAELDREVKIDALAPDDLFGVSSDVSNQNQIPMDIVSVFLEYGLLKE